MAGLDGKGDIPKAFQAPDGTSDRPLPGQTNSPYDPGPWTPDTGKNSGDGTTPADKTPGQGAYVWGSFAPDVVGVDPPKVAGSGGTMAAPPQIPPIFAVIEAFRDSEQLLMDGGSSIMLMERELANLVAQVRDSVFGQGVGEWLHSHTAQPYIFVPDEGVQKLGREFAATINPMMDLVLDYVLGAVNLMGNMAGLLNNTAQSYAAADVQSTFPPLSDAPHAGTG